MTEEQELLLDLFADREILVQALDTGKEHFETHVNQKESQITKSIALDQKNTEDGIINGQHKRNRGIVMEVNDTCQHFRNEITDKIGELRGPDEDYP